MTLARGRIAISGVRCIFAFRRCVPVAREASIVSAVRISVRVIDMDSRKTLIHTINTVTQSNCRRMVRMRGMRFTFAGLERGCTSLVVRNFALSRIWKEWKDSSDLVRVNLIDLRQSIARVRTFLADANLAADMQTSSSIRSSFTCPALDCSTTYPVRRH